jgi:hypothetical protein
MNKKGVEIANDLHQEGYDIHQVRKAFDNLYYVASIEDRGVLILHVSDRPMRGAEALMASEEPRALPEVWWEKLPE